LKKIGISESVVFIHQTLRSHIAESRILDFNVIFPLPLGLPSDNQLPDFSLQFLYLIYFSLSHACYLAARV
jgi:hypothetical protein